MVELSSTTFFVLDYPVAIRESNSFNKFFLSPLHQIFMCKGCFTERINSIIIREHPQNQTTEPNFHLIYSNQFKDHQSYWPQESWFHVSILIQSFPASSWSSPVSQNIHLYSCISPWTLLKHVHTLINSSPSSGSGKYSNSDDILEFHPFNLALWFQESYLNPSGLPKRNPPRFGQVPGRSTCQWPRPRCEFGRV